MTKTLVVDNLVSQENKKKKSNALKTREIKDAAMSKKRKRGGKNEEMSSLYLRFRLQGHLDTHAHEFGGQVSEDVGQRNLVNACSRRAGSALNLPHIRQRVGRMGRNRRCDASTLCTHIALQIATKDKKE